jgi:hypothetical protein
MTVVPNAKARDFAEHLLRPIADVHPGENAAVLLLSLNLFLVIAVY